mgnify:CR=1 FL=1
MLLPTKKFQIWNLIIIVGECPKTHTICLPSWYGQFWEGWKTKNLVRYRITLVHALPTSSQAPRCASCKAHKLEIDQLKSWRVDQLSSVKLAMMKISDPWVQEWRPWEGSVDQLDIGKSDINDTEVKIILNIVHNFKGDLKHSKWGPQTFKMLLKQTGWAPIGTFLTFGSLFIFQGECWFSLHIYSFENCYWSPIWIPFLLICSSYLKGLILCYTCQVWIFRPTVLLSITPTPWYCQWNQHCCDWSKTLSHFGVALVNTVIFIFLWLGRTCNLNTKCTNHPSN